MAHLRPVSAKLNKDGVLYREITVDVRWPDDVAESLEMWRPEAVYHIGICGNGCVVQCQADLRAAMGQPNNSDEEIQADFRDWKPSKKKRERLTPLERMLRDAIRGGVLQEGSTLSDLRRKLEEEEESG